MNDANSDVKFDENEQINERRKKLTALRETKNAYPNHFKRTHLAKPLFAEFEQDDKETLEQKNIAVILAGRIITRRLMGKASFTHIQDYTGKIQIYVQKNAVGDDVYEDFLHFDIGDIVGVSGVLFKTKTNELTVQAKKIELLTKSLRPLPDKFHGLADKELCYRQRYLDLICNNDSREKFQKRIKIIEALRDYLKSEHFLEVETPMMQSLPGGANARPFITHHNALDMRLYLRVAPELYLKRLVVGGFERVFEINRNFRNEGLSTRHNPEFTMVEYYEAYADYNDAMNRLETLIRQTTEKALGTLQVEYQDNSFDLSKPFNRLTLKEAILNYNSALNDEILSDLTTLTQYAEKIGVPVHISWGLGKLQLEIFEKTAEEKLIEPTFITAYPREVSPLARVNDNDPFLTDRFELFIGGRELANGFSELNDPDDQRQRFTQQAESKSHGDDEAMPFDDDYLTALEYGLPPTAGVGIGIDRLVMLLTNTTSIRDIILFPHLRQK